jgi:hypothetical protein
MTTNQSLFELPVLDVRNNCDTCRWQSSSMCPRNPTFIGRPLRDEDRFAYREICHRYVMTHAERERQWKQVMDKLHTNL